MTQAVYLVGVGMTHFKRWPKKTHGQLAQEAIELALNDVSHHLAHDIDQIYFGNCGMQYWQQSNIKGQVCLVPMFQAQTLPVHCPIFNIEGGCATGALAMHQAIQATRSGMSRVSLAIGVEKTFIAHDVSLITDLFASGTDRWHSEEQLTHYQAQADEWELEFTPHPKRSILLDISSLQARIHQKRYNTSLEQIAQVAVKSHAHGALNPKAQYQKIMTRDEILQDHAVIDPLTRSMCAPISDGAAAVIVVHHDYWKTLPSTVQQRSIKVYASAVSSGSLHDASTSSPTTYAAQRAYQQAGLSAQDIDIAEIHDANAYAELIALEDLGFYQAGQAAHHTMQHDTSIEGSLPINLSGGLISKGHPLAASGIAMAHELMTQLRGEANLRTPKRKMPHTALLHNAGGMIGLQEANCVVSILGKT